MRHIRTLLRDYHLLHTDLRHIRTLLETITYCIQTMSHIRTLLETITYCIQIMRHIRTLLETITYCIQTMSHIITLLETITYCIQTMSHIRTLLRDYHLLHADYESHNDIRYKQNLLYGSTRSMTGKIMGIWRKESNKIRFVDVWRWYVIYNYHNSGYYPLSDRYLK
jgi:hypothetical protein